MRTESSHLPGIGQAATPFRPKVDDKYEMRPTGNSVNLEQEMMKVASNQMEYQAVTALYTRSLGLLKTALGKG
jgi:flagellar basal-body rod protein FlgB